MAKEKPKEVIVKLEHLNPNVRKIILEPDVGILSSRKKKFISGIIAYSIPALGLLDAMPRPLGAVMVGPLMIRGNYIYYYKKKHREIIDSINKFGLLETKPEEAYREGWTSPSIVSKTHPIFYVKKNGDLVFLPENRQEYYRFKVQNRNFLNHSIANWRWRAYLRPPLAPEKVRDWAKAKLQAALEKAKEFVPQPIPRPVPVRAYGKLKG
ncbi:MAG: hypothetical protein AABY04_04440 [Candidatus Micrarchaeota archaeon]